MAVRRDGGEALQKVNAKFKKVGVIEVSCTREVTTSKTGMEDKS